MPVQIDIWDVGTEDGPLKILPDILSNESNLEDWITKKPEIIDPNIMLIGKQVTNSYEKRMDLLAITEEGDLVIIELKRGKTPRECIAQLLDYASWIYHATQDEIERIASKFFLNYRGKETTLSAEFKEFFEIAIPENINQDHKMILVASELDDESERIFHYLIDKYKININVFFFTYKQYESGQRQLIRAWLIDPNRIDNEIDASKNMKTGFWFFNVGEKGKETRNWEDCKKFGFLSAGQGLRYKTKMLRIFEGMPLFVFLKKSGYVGFGIVKTRAKPFKDFKFEFNKDYVDVSLLSLLESGSLKSEFLKNNMDDDDKCEYVIEIEWKEMRNRNEGVLGDDLFVYPGTFCAFLKKSSSTVELLKKAFKVSDDILIENNY